MTAAPSRPNRFHKHPIDLAGTAPLLIRLAEAEMANGPLEATPGVIAVLGTYGSEQGSVESLLRRLIVATEGNEIMKDAPGDTERSTSEEGVEA